MRSVKRSVMRRDHFFRPFERFGASRSRSEGPALSFFYGFAGSGAVMIFFVSGSM